MDRRSRRALLADVGRGMLLASIGTGLTAELGLTPAAAEAETAGTLAFGRLEPLVCLMQETPAETLLPRLADRLSAGTPLRDLVAAAALANARTFGGEDYIGFHTMMALSPAYHMARELPVERQPLPVLKVLYRNSARIQETGGRTREVLHPVSPAPAPADAAALCEAVRKQDAGRAEALFAAAARESAAKAFDDLLYAVQDQLEVHRVVLPYRAWDLLEIVGSEHAHTMLRQSVRYCVKAESVRRPAWDEPVALLPQLLEQHRLLERSPGTREGDDAWLAGLSRTIFGSKPADAAAATAAALAEGYSPAQVGEALSLAANELVLRDPGRTPSLEDVGKPVGSVHGDSVGVHACDTANAWRQMAGVASARHTCACLILGAYQVARDRTLGGRDLAGYPPLPLEHHLARVTATDPAELLREAEAAIRGNLQARASAAVHRYGALGHPARPAFELMLRYAVSEDGSLHAEKYYRTVSEEFAATRPAFRWRHLVALARVTASEFGRPAPGYAEACRLLKI
ncbi:MAG: hypothetical protein ACK47B_26430 [Armatimonadota bacterium]